MCKAKHFHFNSLFHVGLQSLAAAQQHSDVSKVDTVCKLVADLEHQLRAAEKEAALLNAREGLLGRPATDYSQIKQLSDVFDPYLAFWSTAGAWKVSRGV
jgi:dynein heavy chain